MKANKKDTHEAKAIKIAQNKKNAQYHKEVLAKQDENLKKEKIAPDGVCISLQHIAKIYPNHVQAVHDFNLDIKPQEFIVFVGPSGCGKSTTLRMIAGLEDITYGDLYISGEFANTLLPASRDCAMVFQSYALYPNMTVFDNMAFSLKIRHMDKKEIAKRVYETAKVLELSDYLARKPSALSGGQRQRVALGRAIVRNAKVFLMDEPLSNLDAKLRVQMRTEIVGIHQKIGATTVYVTHDQTEAMTMADRIVVMKDGYVQQIGTPKEIYNYPSNMFVATFIGAPSMNMIEANIKGNTVTLPNGLSFNLSKEQENSLVESIIQEIKLLKEEIEELKQSNETFSPKLKKKFNFKKFKFVSHDINEDVRALNDQKINENEMMIAKYQTALDEREYNGIIGVRPEDIVSEKASKLIDHKTDLFMIKAKQVELLGNEYYVHSEIDNKKIIAKVSANEEVEANTDIAFALNLDKIHLFDKDSTKRLF